MIEVKAGSRQCWLPLNRIGVKMWDIGIPFRRHNDTFIDALNADIAHFARNGIQPKLYIGSNNSRSNLIFESVAGGRKTNNKKHACQYSVEGVPAGNAIYAQTYYIRIIEDAVDISSKDQYRNIIVHYLTHFIDKDKNLTTNVAYVLPDGADYGKAIYGPDYMGRSGTGSPNCADVVFYGVPSLDVDDIDGSIIIKEGSAAATPFSISYIRRNGPQPPASNFCYLASMKAGVNITSPKRIKNAKLQLTFTRHVDGNPKIIKKGQSIGPIPPGAME